MKTREEAQARAIQVLAQIGEHQLAVVDLQQELATLKGFMAGFQASTDAARASAAMAAPPSTEED